MNTPGSSTPGCYGTFRPLRGVRATIRLLDAATLTPRGGALPIKHAGPGPHAFSPDGSLLAFHTEKRGVRILEAPGLRVLRTVRPGIRTWGLRWLSSRRLLVLGTLAIRCHGPARTVQKVSEGPRRVAAWLGSGTLAVAGADHAFDGGIQHLTPNGLRLVNVETGRTTLVEPRATDVEAAGGIALAGGYDWASSSSGMGVSAYDTAGNLVW